VRVYHVRIERFRILIAQIQQLPIAGIKLRQHRPDLSVESLELLVAIGELSAHAGESRAQAGYQSAHTSAAWQAGSRRHDVNKRLQ